MRGPPPIPLVHNGLIWRRYDMLADKVLAGDKRLHKTAKAERRDLVRR